MHKPLTKTQIAILNNKSVHHVTVKSVSDGMAKSERAIKPSTNVKLGKQVVKGWLTGAKIYTLTLEERATCPQCDHYNDCFGNPMYQATRYTVDKFLLKEIESNLEEYSLKGKPFLVRLHVLGDFESVSYVSFWERMLKAFPLLNIYGYTARQSDTPIGKALIKLRNEFGLRFMVRQSGDFKALTMSALSFDNPKALPMIKDKKAFVCPTQITTRGEYKLAKKGEKTLTDNCGTCGLCWTAKLPVVFITH